MRTLRIAGAGAVVWAMLVVQAGSVIAQSDVPEPADRAIVTGTELCWPIQQGTESLPADEPGVGHYRGYVYNCRNETTDPRVDGTYRNTLNKDCYHMAALDDIACAIWGTHVLEGDEGGWDCSYTGTDDLWGPNALQVLVVCPGTGVYEGMTYVFHHVSGAPQGFGDGTDIRGIIYEGPPPAWGPAAEPTAE